MGQKRISIMSNAGGTGKTTVTVNLAFQLARLGARVCMIGCDPNGSLTLFTGLDDPAAEQTLDKVLSPNFEGDWPLFPVWSDRIDGVDACLGGLPLVETAKRIDKESRGSYLLADAIEDHPLSHDVILIDCPGTIERFHEVALSASNGVLIVARPVDKDIDAGFKLLDWIYATRKALRLKPTPKVLGVCINGYRKNLAMHRDNMGDDLERSLPLALDNMGIHCFPPIPEIAYLTTSGACGLPLGIWRPGEKTNSIFEQIASFIKEEEFDG